MTRETGFKYAIPGSVSIGGRGWPAMTKYKVVTMMASATEQLPTRDWAQVGGTWSMSVGGKG